MWYPSINLAQPKSSPFNAQDSNRKLTEKAASLYVHALNYLKGQMNEQKCQNAILTNQTLKLFIIE